MTYQAPPITRNARIDASSNPVSSRRSRSSAAAATITTTTSPTPAPPLMSAANPSNDPNDQRAPRDIDPQRAAQVLAVEFREQPVPATAHLPDDAGVERLVVADEVADADGRKIEREGEQRDRSGHHPAVVEKPHGETFVPAAGSKYTAFSCFVGSWCLRLRWRSTCGARGCRSPTPPNRRKRSSSGRWSTAAIGCCRESTAS